MATANDIANTLNANYKQVYGDDLEMLVPEGVKALDDIKLEMGEQQQGGTFNQPVGLGLEHGITFEAGDVVANLNAAVAGKLENAQVTGYQIVGRAQFGWTTASRAAGSKKAFKQATEIVLRNLMLSCKKKAEALMFYGQSSLGAVASVAGNVITLNVADSAEGIWVGMTNMPIDSYTSGGVLRQSNMRVISVTLLSTGAVQITVDNAGGTNTNDTLWYYNSYGKQFQGINSILTSSGGTLFNISQATYPDLWQGTTYAVGGNLGYAKIVKALARALPKGGEGRFKGYIHQESWQDVVGEVETVASGNMDSRYKPKMLEKGFDSIKFHTVAGIVELVPSTYVKRGDGFLLLQDGSWKRIGSTDFTMKIPGMQNGEVFRALDNAAGFEVRCYADFAPFCDKPAASIKLTGITQSA